MFLSKRGGVYQLFFLDESGKRRTRSTGTRKKPEAVKFLRAFNAEEDARRRAVQHITLKDFSALLLTYSRNINTPKTVEANRTALNELSRFIGAGCILSNLTPADCERFLAKKTADASAWTARKYFLALGAAFERARTWGHITDNPWRKMKKPRTPEVIPAYFTREQFSTLLAKIQNRDFRELVTVAALTGLRRGELLAMEWNWLDFSRRVLTVTNSERFTTKSKRARVVPMCDEVFKVLLSRRERMSTESGLVFHWHGRRLSENKVSRRMKKAVRDAKLPETLHFHSTRHAFASWLVQGGVSLYQVARLLGHSSTAVTEKYAHLVPSDMHGILGPLHLEN
jgi:site-specific recombinase XerD